MSNYAQHEHHDFQGAAGQALRNAPLQAALARLTDTLMTANRRGYAALADSEQVRDHAKRIFHEPQQAACHTGARSCSADDRTFSRLRFGWWVDGLRE